MRKVRECLERIPHASSAAQRLSDGGAMVRLRPSRLAASLLVALRRYAMKMTRSTFGVALLGTISLALLGSRPAPIAPAGSGLGAPEARAGISEATKTKALDLYGKLPLSFEANHGQTDPRVRFLSRGRGYTLFLTATEAVLALRKPTRPENANHLFVPGGEIVPEGFDSVAVRQKLVGANPDPKVSGLEELSGRSNYFLGNDPGRWRTDIPHYAKVAYKNIYSGIDLVYHGSREASSQLEYDFIVAPGADPKAITLHFEGAEKLELDARGDLVLHIAGGEIRQPRPLIHQEQGRVRREIAGGYILKANNEVSFQVAAYDPRRPLIIDPVLIYSTYLGSSGSDWGNGIAVDATGGAYITGITTSTDFPTTSAAFDTSFNGVFDPTFRTSRTRYRAKGPVGFFEGQALHLTDETLEPLVVANPLPA